MLLVPTVPQTKLSSDKVYQMINFSGDCVRCFPTTNSHRKLHARFTTHKGRFYPSTTSFWSSTTKLQVVDTLDDEWGNKSFSHVSSSLRYSLHREYLDVPCNRIDNDNSDCLISCVFHIQDMFVM